MALRVGQPRHRISVFVTALLVSSTVSTRAQVRLPGADINVDTAIKLEVDQKTKEWINSLVPVIGDEAVKVLMKSLDRIDTSASRHLDRIDEIIYARINQVFACGPAFTGGLLRGISDRLYSWFGYPSNSIKEIDDNWRTFGGRITRNMTPADIAIAYEGFLNEVGVTECQLTDPSLKRRPHQIRTLIHERRRMWLDLGETCQSAANCLERRIQEVKKLVANADQRDVDSKDSAELGVIAPLPAPGFFGSFDYKQFEDGLLKLYNIHRHTEVTRVIREKNAKDHLTLATGKYIIAKNVLAEAKTLVNPPEPVREGNYELNLAAQARADASVAERDVIAKELDAAVTAWPQLKQEADKIRQEMARLLADAGATKDSALDKNKKILAWRAAQKDIPPREPRK